VHVDGDVHIEPGSGISFIPEDDSCSNISCHSNTEAEWGNSACLYCHSISINDRAAITPQFNNANSHHIQGVEVTGAHCYQCHWEANDDGTINGTYHGGSKASGSAVDLVIYLITGELTQRRPTTYTLDVTAKQYTANDAFNRRVQLARINTHCLSCHSSQNNSTIPFEDGKTPNQYAWDVMRTSIDARYSQTGTTTWGKYRRIFIDESFEGTGYEETWTGGGTDPDSPIPGTPPVGAGSQCLKSTGNMAYATRDLGSEQPKTFTSFYLYVEGLGDVNYKQIGVLRNSEWWEVFTLGLSKISGQLRFNLRLYTSSLTFTNYYANISENTWYRIEVIYDNVNNTWGWQVFDGVIKIAENSGPLSIEHYNGIQEWTFGFMYIQPVTGSIYFDLVKANNGSWDEAFGGRNVTPKNTQAKAYSAHGNATNNQGGWDLNEAWLNTRNGTENIACFDCHNSHGSNISGVTTSYTSETTNGGILKDTVAGQGGYSMTYKPQIGGSTEDKSAYSAGAGLCFDCHLTSDGGTSKPWGYQSTFETTQAIMGYWDTPYFGPGTFGSHQRFGYKSLKPHQGGHLGASSALLSPPNPDKAINGLCTPCHDPHGVSPALGASMQYGVPLLKGTWLTSPYMEDSPPMNNVAGTGRTDRSQEGVKFYIDQNTFGSDMWDDTLTGIQESDTQFAGLCLRCHPKNSLTDGVNHDWKSKDRIHESVKGWKTATGPIQHNYPCSKCHTPHNSRLPRLMVTNCLDGMHKGRVGKNPSPITSGSGSGYGIACGFCLHTDYEYGVDCGSFCSGLSGTIGRCYDQLFSGSGSGGIGSGEGYMPGFWRAQGKHVGGEHIPANICHTRNDVFSDQSWNEKTQWFDDTVSITKGPEAGSFKAVGSDIRATITWETSQDSTSYVEYGLTISYEDPQSPQGNDTLILNHSITLTNLTNHSTYHYRVRSTGSLGKEVVSEDNTFYISFPPSTPIPLCGGQTVCSSTSCPITLQWAASSDPDSGPVQYYVEVDDDWNFGSPEPVLDWTPGETLCVDSQCSWTTNVYKPDQWSQKDYYWRIRARDENYPELVSDWSWSWCQFIVSSPPDAPTLIHEPNVVSTVPVPVTFKWNPSAYSSPDPIEFDVQVADNDAFDSPTDSGWISEETYCNGFPPECSWPVPDPLDTGTKWYWRVQERVSSYPDEPSQWSYTDSFTIMSSNPPPAPTLIHEPDVVSTVPVFVTLKWKSVTDPDGDPVDYYVKVRDVSGLSDPIESDWISGNCVSGVCSWMVPLDQGIIWYWIVQARDRNHQEAVSDWSLADYFGIYTSPTIINESFEETKSVENDGYDEDWAETLNGGTLDPDFAISELVGTPPPVAGSQCLQSISSTTNYKAYATRDYGFEKSRTFTSFYLYVKAEGLNNGNNKPVGALRDKDNNNVFIFRLNQEAGQLRFILRLMYNNGSSFTDDAVNISLNTWYRIEVKYDTTNPGATDACEWWVDGVPQGNSNLTSLGVYYSGIQRWVYGFLGSQTITGTVYFDLVTVNINE
jgi:hypothetical protein